MVGGVAGVGAAAPGVAQASALPAGLSPPGLMLEQLEQIASSVQLLASQMAVCMKLVPGLAEACGRQPEAPPVPVVPEVPPRAVAHMDQTGGQVKRSAADLGLDDAERDRVLDEEAWVDEALPSAPQSAEHPGLEEHVAELQGTAVEMHEQAQQSGSVVVSGLAQVEIDAVEQQGADALRAAAQACG